jgi:hypothetical protein
MDARLIFVLILIIIAWFVLSPGKKVQGSSVEKTATQDPSFSASDGSISVATPDDLDAVIRSTQVALSKQLGKCTYCLETTSLNISNNLFSGRFLFTVLPEQGGGAYGVSVDSLVDKADNFNVKNISLQAMNTIDVMDPYSQFKSGREIEEGVLPNLTDLQSAMNA